MADNQDWIPEPTGADLERLRNLLYAIGGEQVQWGARSLLEVFVIEQRLRAERLATQRLMRATWVLAGATIALVVATAGLIGATWVD